MSAASQDFVDHLKRLERENRGALAELRRSLAFAPGAYPRVYPLVERFVGAGRHAEDPWRLALYLAAALFASDPRHAAGVPFARAFGSLARERESSSLEMRFVALLDADSAGIANAMRQLTALLAADDRAFDYSSLVDDLRSLLDDRHTDRRDRVRQRWGRSFYEALYPREQSSQNEPVSIPEAELAS